MKKLIFLFFVALLLLTNPALAQNELFFEFAPDPWRSERLDITTKTPYQIFQPNINTLLTGFDFWMDNAGATDQTTFTLANANNTTLAVKTISLPTMNPKPGGHKIHIDLINPVQLSAGQTYSIKIKPATNGIGIYHANRLNVIEHNQPHQSEFAQGAAQLDEDLQLFTFKMALYHPAPTDTEDEDDPDQNATTTISITNARIAALTDTTALVAWTTNVAADTRVTLRTQLNPFSIIQTGYDPTLELEHVILLTGLIPEVNYFADTYSSLGENIVLTTYTLAFQTPPTSNTDGDDADTDGDGDDTDTNTDGDDTDTNTDGDGADTGSDQDNNDPSGLPPPTITNDNLNKSTNFSWSPPTNGEPSEGYRIDIFDHNYNLERQVAVGPGTHEKNIPQLYSGTHHVIIYANNDGTYSKAASPESFIVQAKGSSIFWKALIMILFWLGGLGGYLYWKFKHKKNVLPPEKGYDPNK